MGFWRLTDPRGASDYEHAHTNGSLEHPYGLPGVNCNVCRQIWGGSRILPYACPERMQNAKGMTDRWPIPRAEHEALQTELMHELLIGGLPFVVLRPGDDLQPCFLDLPTRPRADFLWCSLGSLVVSKTIKDLLVKVCPQDISVHPVVLGAIGDRDVNEPVSIPESGEPEGIIREVPLVSDTSGLSPYFEVLIQGESKYPPGGEPVSICPGCQRPNVDNSKRQITMNSEMWQGQEIFFLATTLYAIVTDGLRSAIEGCGATNIRFEPAEKRVPEP